MQKTVAANDDEDVDDADDDDDVDDDADDDDGYDNDNDDDGDDENYDDDAESFSRRVWLYCDSDQISTFPKFSKADLANLPPQLCSGDFLPPCVASLRSNDLCF